MTFFRQIADLGLVGNLKLTIRNIGGHLTVSVLLDNEQCGDDARRMIIPMVLNGTAADMDNGFFEKITTPLQSASGLMVNMEQHLASVEKAKVSAAAEKKGKEAPKEPAKESKPEPPKVDPKVEAYAAALKKADDLAGAGKFKEAIAALPKVEEYPEKTEEIFQKRKDIEKKANAGTIFELMQS